MAVRSLLRRLIPGTFQPPTALPKKILAGLGYFRLRTYLAARGEQVPDIGLYRPLFSPWEGMGDFERAYQAASPYTLVARDRCYVLWRTIQQALALPGDMMECGVFRGGTALLAAMTVADRFDGRELHLFDTFDGLPEGKAGVDALGRGDLGQTSLAKVRTLLAPYSFADFHPGLIPQTFSGLEIRRIAWAHVDVDLYQSVRDCVDFIYPRLVPGGFMIFDDYGFPSCPGARRAVDERFADRDEKPLCLPTGQCLVVKLPAASP